MKDVQQRDFYQVLGIKPNADQQEIERAYKKLVDRYHLTPHQQSFLDDVPQKDDMALINEAYKTLSSSGSRVMYDQRNSDAPEMTPVSKAPSEKAIPDVRKAEKKKPGNIYQDYFGFSEKQ